MGMTGKTGSDLRLALLARIAVAQPLHEDLHKLLQVLHSWTLLSLARIQGTA